MEIFNAMNAIRGINRERDAIQTFAANDATETFWVIRFSSGSQNSIQYRVLTNAAFFQRILKILLKVNISWNDNEMHIWREINRILFNFTRFLIIFNSMVREKYHKLTYKIIQRSTINIVRTFGNS